MKYNPKKRFFFGAASFGTFLGFLNRQLDTGVRQSTPTFYFNNLA